jgi:hypothetical protein
VEAELDFLEACCCKRLTFSCPFAGVIGLFSALALAIDLEIIPGDSALNFCQRAISNVRYPIDRLTCLWPLRLPLFGGSTVAPVA